MNRSHTRARDLDEDGATARGPQQETPSRDVELTAADGDTVKAAHTSEARRQVEAAHACSCSTDCLQIIFSFLPLVDVASSAAACRRWSAAAAAATGGDEHRIISTSVRTLRALAVSPLRCFVADIDFSPTTLMAADRVESLWSAFPHLTSLTCKIDASYLASGTSLQFPITLRTLDVTIALTVEHVFLWPPLDVLLSLAVRCPLRRLRVVIPRSTYRDGSPPVHTIERLRALSGTMIDLELDVRVIYLRQRWRWEAAHLAVFRSLPHLTRLHIASGFWDSQELELLTAEPTSLPHLRSLDVKFPSRLDVASLSRLPLTELHLSCLRNEGLPILSHLPHLTTVNLQGEHVSRYARDTFDPLQLSPVLATCVRITDLTLSRIGSEAAPDDWLIPSLTGMRQLRSLRLLSTSAPLARMAAIPHLAATLEHLELDTTHSASALASLRSLPRLKSARFDSIDLSMGDPITLAKSDREMIFLPLLGSLSLTLHGRPGSGDVDLSRVFGRLPALRTLTLEMERHAHGGLMALLTRLTGVTSLNLRQERMNSADLARVLSSMTHLRELDLTYQRRDLSFLSSSAGLAHTLERLTLTLRHRVSPRDLLHLQSLVSLRYLSVRAWVAVPVQSQSRGRIARMMHTMFDRLWTCATRSRTDIDDESIASSSVALSAAPPLVFSSLRDLRLELDPRDRFTHVDHERAPTSPIVDLARILGRLPQLRSATLDCGPVVQVDSIGAALAHSTQLTDLTLKHDQLICAHLISALRPLTRLRSLVMESTSPGGLAFASEVPHLADTLEHLTVRTTWKGRCTPAVSQLDHLRPLTHLRKLELFFYENWYDRELSRPSHHHAIWPHLHNASIDV